MKTKVLGLGGAFIYSHDPTKLATWYRDILGIPVIQNEEYGANYAVFQYLEEVDSTQKVTIVWSIMKAKEGVVCPSNQFMFNYRVADLDALVKELRENSIEVQDVQVYPEGKFTWMHDPDGNKIELWQDTSQ